jgi:hypothetical protein
MAIVSVIESLKRLFGGGKDVVTVEVLVGVKLDKDGDGKPEVRLTPVHEKVVLPSVVAEMLLYATAQADAKDSSPNNGELELRIPNEALRQFRVPEPFGYILRTAVQSQKAKADAFVVIRKKKA